VQLRIITFLVVAGLVATRIAGAEDPCAADVKQFCSNTQVGSVQECLKQNEARLSAACVAKRAADDARFRALVQEFGPSCHRDIDRLCGEIKPGR
jgi:hypothetical protein